MLLELLPPKKVALEDRAFIVEMIKSRARYVREDVV
jgi:hypothetical protein